VRVLKNLQVEYIAGKLPYQKFKISIVEKLLVI